MAEIFTTTAKFYIGFSKGLFLLVRHVLLAIMTILFHFYYVLISLSLLLL